jgi:hypothetical protein
MERESSFQRCLRCDGVIDGLADDGAIGFDARFGLFSDGCAFVCNDCTASLIEAAAVRRKREWVYSKWPVPAARRNQSAPKAS